MTINNIPRPEYPRPDFCRDSFQNLNGPWSFAFDDGDVGLDQRWYERQTLDRTIIVPYVYQCEMSGIYDKSFHNVVWYQKRVTIRRQPGCDRVLLHFGAVDYQAAVWVNGHHVGEHAGGNSPFVFDVPREAALDGAHDGERLLGEAQPLPPGAPDKEPAGGRDDRARLTRSPQAGHLQTLLGWRRARAARLRLCEQRSQLPLDLLAHGTSRRGRHSFTSGQGASATHMRQPLIYSKHIAEKNVRP